MHLKAFKKVFKSPKYIILAAAIFTGIFLVTTLYRNFGLIETIWSQAGFTAGLKLISNLLFAASSSMGVLSVILIFLISILFAVNISYLIYYLLLQKSRVVKTEVGGSGLGLVLGLIGVGCASCGSAILLSLLSIFGATGALAILPLHGMEFTILGVLLLMYSIHSLSRKITGPLVC